MDWEEEGKIDIRKIIIVGKKIALCRKQTLPRM